MNRRDFNKEGGQETKSQNTDAQGTRAPTTTLYVVLCGLQEGIRLYLP